MEQFASKSEIHSNTVAGRHGRLAGADSAELDFLGESAANGKGIGSIALERESRPAVRRLGMADEDRQEVGLVADLTRSMEAEENEAEKVNLTPFLTYFHNYYGYDANGSMTAASDTSTAYARMYNSPGNNYYYTQEDTTGTYTTYGYDVRNRMINEAATNEDDYVYSTANYSYNDAGERVSENNNGTTTTYLYDTQNPTGYDQIIEERNSAGTAQDTFIIGLDNIAQMSSGGTLLYLLKDGHGYTRVITSSSGSVTQSMDFDAYGNALFNESTAATDHQTPDGIYDFATGFTRDGDRDREGPIFFEQDDYGFGNNRNPLSLNRMTYANGDPENGTDPSGHEDLGSLLGTMDLGLGLDYSAAVTPYNIGRRFGLISSDDYPDDDLWGPLGDDLAVSEAWVEGFAEGAVQGLANALNGVTDAFIGLANLAIEASPGGSIASALGINLSIPVPDWSQGLIYNEDPTEHSISKFLGGQGIITIASLGVGAALSDAGDIHHVATICNENWTPAFQELFDEAGIDMDDAVNKVRVVDHVGPHPNLYHDIVYNRLISATAGKTGEAFSDALFDAIDDMADECATPGTQLNYLIYQPLLSFYENDMIDYEKYLSEMSDGIRRAVSLTRENFPNIQIYTISIMTELYQGRSLISFDTFDNSEVSRELDNKSLERLREQYRVEGNLKRAARVRSPFLRGSVPPKFKYPNVLIIEHKSLADANLFDDRDWEKLSELQAKVMEDFVREARVLNLHPDAELGVNSKKLLYDRAIKISKAISTV